MTDRRYLPTLAELIDRLCICQLKSIYIRKDLYDREIEDILHDVDLLLPALEVSAETIRAVIVNAIANRVIWENESKARAGGSEQDHLLKFTHSINGVRNNAKNIITLTTGGKRIDIKTDCLAADLPEGYGNWNIWGNE